MPKKFQMTWVAHSRRWTKFHRGKRYFISCRQLGVPETKEASWRAANEWWDRQQGIADLPTEDDRLARAARISNLVRDFSGLDDDGRREAVEALLGAGSYDGLKSKAGAMLAGMDAATPERTVGAGRDVEESAPGRLPVASALGRALRRLLPQDSSLHGLDGARIGHRRDRRGEAGGILQPPGRQGRGRELFPQLRSRTDDDCQAVHRPPGRAKADPPAG